MLSIMLMKHNFKLLRQSKSKDVNILIERRIIVTEHFISSSRFNLELKVNMKFLTN